MPYIIPFSTIELCNIPGLDNTYQHTLNFANDTVQLDFFRSHRIDIPESPGTIIADTLMKQNYVRVKRVGVSTIRVELPIKYVAKANYMIVYNHGENSENHNPVTYEKDYFYAFITDYNYVSEEVTEINFEIDVIQSYLFDYDELPCMVLREHVNSDYAGEHIAGEPVDIGPVITRSFEQDELFENYIIVVATAYPGS